MKICKDGRVSGQNNKGAGTHLGVLTGRQPYIKKGTASGSKRGNRNPMFGRHHSKETLDKMSQVKLGEKNPMFGNIYSEEELKRKREIRHSIETRMKMGESKRGKKHWNWKGGVTDLNNRIRNMIEFRLWREAVFARDAWTCQECGKRGVRLESHHIKSFAEYPDLRLAIDNGRTLCAECHKLTENYAGRCKRKDAVHI